MHRPYTDWLLIVCSLLDILVGIIIGISVNHYFPKYTAWLF